MNNNNLILINSYLEELLQEKGFSIKPNDTEMGKIFETIAVSQILKKYGLSEDEILSCLTDGERDGGIDFGFIFFNGSLIKDISRFPFQPDECKIDVYIITSKYETTFRNSPLETMIVSIPEIFDISLSEKKVSYNDKIKKFRETVNFVYQKYILKMKSFKIHFIYVSRGDTDLIQGEIINRKEQLIKRTSDTLSEAIVDFNFIGCSELVKLIRQSNIIEKALPIQESINSGDNYIILCNIKDYYHFLLNDDFTINKRLFDTNVRDYMGLNRVNKDIIHSLEFEKKIDFWNLNNGITIISPKAIVAGKKAIMENPQIVNGLQTSESIYSYYSRITEEDDDERLILIKLIVETDSSIQKKIIQSTNNQTPVDLVSLYATDTYLKDIETYLQKFDIYFDRKHNFFKNAGVSQDKLVSLLYLASGYLALCLKQPAMSSGLRQKNLDKVYKKIFNKNNDIELWYSIVLINQKTDAYLNKKRGKGNTEGFLRKWRPFFSYLVCSIITGTFSYSMKQLKDISQDMSKFKEKIYDEIWDYFAQNYAPLTKNINKTKNIRIMEEIGNKKKLKNIEYLNSINKTFMGKTSVISIDFIQQVNNLLPRQPWPRYTAEKIAKKLGCTINDVREAIDCLIEDEIFYRQKDGILYDSKGKVVKQ